MKKFIFLMFLPSMAFANGPIFQHKDTFVQQEFENVYQDLRTKLSTVTIPSNSITTYVSSVNVSTPLTVTPNGTLGSTLIIGVNSSSVTLLGNGNLAFQGRTTNVSQPSFMAYNSATDSNVTGDNTTVTVEFDTEQYDQAGNFASNTFTAPVAGKYLLSTGVTYREEATGNKCEVKIVTTAKTFVQENWPVSNISTSLTVVASMSANDTATVSLNCSGGAKVVDILGSNGTTTGVGEPTFFSGNLLN
jgi:hypothetical protein